MMKLDFDLAFDKWRSVKSICPDMVVMVENAPDQYVTYGEDCAAVWGRGMIYRVVLSGLVRDERMTIPAEALPEIHERLNGRSYTVIQ